MAQIENRIPRTSASQRLVTAAGTASSSIPSSTQEKITQVFNAHFYGSVGNVAAGGSNFSQNAIIKVISLVLSKPLLNYINA